MIENVAGIDTDLNTLRFADPERFAGAHIQGPVSEVCKGIEPEVSDLSGRGVFQHHFAWGPIRVAFCQSRESADAYCLEIGSHLISSRDLSRIRALRVRSARELVAEQGP